MTPGPPTLMLDTIAVRFLSLESHLADDSSTCTCEVLWSHGPFTLESNRITIKQLIMLLEPLNEFTSYHNFTVAPFQHSRNTGNNASRGLAVMCEVGARHFGRHKIGILAMALIWSTNQKSKLFSLPSLACNACGYMWGVNVEFWSATQRCWSIAFQLHGSLKMKMHHY